MKKPYSIYISLFVIVLSSGCGPKRPDGMPPLYPLTLQVTQKGEPLAEASVSLFSADGSSTWSSGGLTGEDGNLVVFTHGKYSGVPAGKYKVTVDCVASDNPAPKSLTMEELDAHNRKYPSYRIVPIPYTERSSTPLEIEVARKSNKMTVDIPEKVKSALGGPP